MVKYPRRIPLRAGHGRVCSPSRMGAAALFLPGENRGSLIFCAPFAHTESEKKSCCFRGRNVMKNYVITIAREKRKQTAAPSARRWPAPGHPLYNRDILRMAADDSGINEQLFANAEKSFRSSLLFRVAKDALQRRGHPAGQRQLCFQREPVPLPGQGDAGPGAEQAV